MISPIRKRALEWLQSCETSTPTVEEVERLIHTVAKEYFEEGRHDALLKSQCIPMFGECSKH